MSKPKRRYHLTLTISGDTLECVKRELREIESHLFEHWNGIGAGKNSSFSGKMEFDAEMTEDKYERLLREYLDEMYEEEKRVIGRTMSRDLPRPLQVNARGDMPPIEVGQ